MTNLTRRAFTLGLGMVAAAPLLAACGDDERTPAAGHVIVVGAWIHGSEGNPLTELADQAGARTVVTDFDNVAVPTREPRCRAKRSPRRCRRGPTSSGRSTTRPTLPPLTRRWPTS